MLYIIVSEWSIQVFFKTRAVEASMAWSLRRQPPTCKVKRSDPASVVGVRYKNESPAQDLYIVKNMYCMENHIQKKQGI